MISDEERIFQNACNYGKRRNKEIMRQGSPGHGMEGRVWKTTSHSVLKAFYRHESYKTELSCYERLLEHKVNSIHNLEVPVLEGFEHSLQVIEITFVQPPYLLDFGKATLDDPPEYLRDPQDLHRFQSQWKAEFGNRWPDVNALLYTLETKYGIFYLDPRPQNICFNDPEDDMDDWMKEPPIDYSEYE